MSNFYNKVSLSYTKPIYKRMTLQEISQANQWINGENGNDRDKYLHKTLGLLTNNYYYLILA